MEPSDLEAAHTLVFAASVLLGEVTLPPSVPDQTSLKRKRTEDDALGKRPSNESFSFAAAASASAPPSMPEPPPPPPPPPPPLEEPQWSASDVMSQSSQPNEENIENSTVWSQSTMGSLVWNVSAVQNDFKVLDLRDGRPLQPPPHGKDVVLGASLSIRAECGDAHEAFIRNLKPSFTFTSDKADILRPSLEAGRGLLFAIPAEDDGLEMQMRMRGSPSDSTWRWDAYVYRISFIKQTMDDQFTSLLTRNKLPLVLDLDDTLDRAINMFDTAQVEVIKKTQPERLVYLEKTKMFVVLAVNVHEFLKELQPLFEVILCSLGDAVYVEEMRAVLDPTGDIIVRAYSCRRKFEALKAQKPKRPPKDLVDLYLFCSRYSTLPIIVDDDASPWVQRDNIILVRPTNEPAWDTSLNKNILPVLKSVHEAFFSQLEINMQSPDARLLDAAPNVRSILQRLGQP